jgi:ferredoxin--NADP+ reductase
VPTVVSLNSIMVDGTGMCGACRVGVGGQTRFVCVDGPEFDGHQVDWDQLLARQRIYPEQQKLAVEKWEHQRQCG